MIYFLIALSFFTIIIARIGTKREIKTLRDEIDLLKVEKRMSDYRISSLVKEIDYHLHKDSDELANSYFANCKELRDSKGNSYHDAFKVWSGK